MRTIYLYAALAVAMTAGAGCHKGMVRLQAAPGAADYEWRNPIDRETFQPAWGSLLYAVSAPVGYARGRQQPSGGFILNARLRWNDAVKPLGFHFDNLIQRHNAADISVSEFQERKAQLLDAVAALADDRTALGAALTACVEAEKGLLMEPAPDEKAQLQSKMEKARADADVVIQRATQRVKDLGAREATTDVLAQSAVPSVAVAR